MDASKYIAAFQQSQSLLLMLDTDFIIIAVSDAYLMVAKMEREKMIRRYIFDVFPDNPDDITSDGESKVRASLNRVIATKKNDTLALIKYDIPRPASEGGGYTMKYWRTCHSPILDESNNVQYIMQLVEDVTANETLAAQLEAEQKLLKQVGDSEKRYSLLLMKSPFAFAVFKGKEMVITLANDRIKKIWGKGSDVEGKRLLDVLPELKDTEYPFLLNEVYTTGNPFYGDESFYLSHRERVAEESYFNFIYQPYLEADETISGVTVIVYDVTEMVIARKKVEESKLRFRSMMETIPQIAWTNTVDLEVNFYNQRWYDYTGLDYNQSQGSGWKNVVHPDDKKDTFYQFNTILKTMKGGGFQTRLQSSDTKYRWHLIRLKPIEDEAGKIQLWVGTATDIQELKLLQQQKDDFISIASHELKTPVTSLKLSLQLLNELKESLSSPIVENLITQANRSLDKFTVLIEDLLDASKANDGQLHLNKKLITLSHTVGDCCSHVELANLYTLTFEGDMELKVYADAERIDQVMVNLVNNAMKHAPSSKEIKVLIEKVNGMVKVSVIDKGPGIEPEKIQHLFERYYQVAANGTQYTTGMGLGLYIAAEIVKKHRGQIGVESKVGKGSSFWFTLPL